MVDIAEHQARVEPMKNQSEVTVDAGGPEITIFDVFQPVTREAGIGGIGLQIKAGQLGGFLLIAIELCKAVLEGVGEQESHGIRIQNKSNAIASGQIKSKTNQRGRDD